MRREGQEARTVRLWLVSEPETVYSAMEAGCEAVGGMTGGVNARAAIDSGYSEAANDSQGFFRDLAGVPRCNIPAVLGAWVVVELYKVLGVEQKTKRSREGLQRLGRGTGLECRG